MTVIDDPAVTRRARSQIARRRGALIGLILIILGAWGALIPFIGPYFHYAYTPDYAWHWTASRGWLEVLPGTVTALGGLLVLMSNSRATAVLGAWLAAAGGAWFAIGTSFVPIFHTGSVGTPAASHATLRVLEAIGYFYGLGVVIVFFAATASGRLSVRSLADIHVAQRELDEEAGARMRTHATDNDGDADSKLDAGGTRQKQAEKHAADTERVEPATVTQPPAAPEYRPSPAAERVGYDGIDGHRSTGDGATAASDTDRTAADYQNQSQTKRWNPLNRNR
jgi:hypothetical protein